MNDDSLIGWVATGVVTVIGSLASAVAMLFKLNESKNTKAIASQERAIASQEQTITFLTQRADECDRDRQQLRSDVKDLKEKVSRFTL